MQTQTYYAYIERSSAISNRIFFREELLQLLQCSAILSYFLLQIKSKQKFLIPFSKAMGVTTALFAKLPRAAGSPQKKGCCDATSFDKAVVEYA